MKCNVAAIASLKTGSIVAFVEDRNLSQKTIIATWLASEGVPPEHADRYCVVRGPLIPWATILTRAGIDPDPSGILEHAAASDRPAISADDLDWDSIVAEVARKGVAQLCDEFTEVPLQEQFKTEHEAYRRGLTLVTEPTGLWVHQD